MKEGDKGVTRRSEGGKKGKRIGETRENEGEDKWETKRETRG